MNKFLYFLTRFLYICSIALIGGFWGLFLKNLDFQFVSAAWFDNGWTYRRPVSISYSGTTLSDYDVLIELDTASLIAANKMQADCDDIRIVDSDETTPINYWIEGGCNTNATQIWAQVPLISDGGKTIYIYYGNSSAVNAELVWSGNFILLSTDSCSAGWTRNIDFDSRFPYGASSYGGTGGASSHSHGDASCTVGTNAVSSTGIGWSAILLSTLYHTHTAYININDGSSLPPYLNMVFCQNSELTVPAGMVALFDSSVPTGWTRFTALDSRFPQGAASYGETGGSATHTHSATGTASSTPSAYEYHQNGSNWTAQRDPHYHNSQDTITGPGNSIPPYLNMVFGSKDTQGVVPSNTISMFNALPPLGWTRFTALDSRFPQGAASYGETGGSATHTHSVVISLGSPIYTGATAGWRSGYSKYTRWSHTHSACTATTDSQSNIPPYLETIFAKKKSPIATTSVGEEMTNGPTAPTITSPTALSATSIRWNFVDNSDNEIGFRIYDSSNTLKVTCAASDLNYCDETGLSPNTQYTRKVVAYNNDGNSTYSLTVSIYTLAATPEAPTVSNAQVNSLDVNLDPQADSTSTEMAIYKEVGSSCDGVDGSYLAVDGSDNGSTPVWQSEDAWGTVTATGLSAMTQYSFCTKARNNDGVETSWSDAGTASTIENDAPSISGVASVAGDTTSNYYDTTDDGSTEVVFSATDGNGGGVSACRWSTLDVAYDLMSNSCASTSSCAVNLSGEGTKTVYIRCRDVYSNKMSSSQMVSFTIDATSPLNLSSTNSSPSWVNAKPTVTVSTPTDSLSGIKEIRYAWDSNVLGANCTGGTATTAGADLTGTLSEGSHILYLCASDQAGNVTTWNGSYKWDNGSPLVNITTHALTTYRAANIPAKIKGTASDAVSAVASTAVSIYNGVKYWSGSAFDSLTKVWLAATGTVSWEYSFSPTQDGEYTIQSRSTDGAGNSAVSSATVFTYDTSTPTLTVSEASTPTTSGAAITWTTNERSSTQVEYGVNMNYGALTDETDTSTRVTEHRAVLTNLQQCTIYHYRTISRDSAGNTLTGDDQTFTTTGCVGLAEIKAKASQTVTTDSGGEVELKENGTPKVKLAVPANFANSNVDFQIKKLEKETVLLTISTPSTSKKVIGDHVYQLDALAGVSEKVSTFVKEITITMTYTDDQISNYDEASLVIYRWDGSNWNELSNCSVDTDANIVSCTTSAFSTFVLFGEESQSSPESSSDSSSPTTSSCTDLPPGPNPVRIYAAVPRDQNHITLYFTNGDEPIDRYSIRYGLEPNNYIYGATNIAGDGERTYTVGNLSPNTTYYFQIRGDNNCKAGYWSNELSATTLKATKDPLNTITTVSEAESTSMDTINKTEQERGLEKDVSKSTDNKKQVSQSRPDDEPRQNEGLDGLWEKIKRIWYQGFYYLKNKINYFKSKIEIEKLATHL